MTRVIDMWPIRNMNPAKNFKDNDLREVARDLETIFGRQVTVCAFNREEYTICENQESLDQIVDMKVTLREFGGYHVVELRGCY